MLLDMKTDESLGSTCSNISTVVKVDSEHSNILHMWAFFSGVVIVTRGIS